MARNRKINHRGMVKRRILNYRYGKNVTFNYKSMVTNRIVNCTHSQKQDNEMQA